MRYLTIALTKGRLAEKTLDMLEQIGITCEEMRDKSSRKLIFVDVYKRQGSRQAFVVLPIMTIGRIRYAAASFWIRERISFPTEWGNIRSYRSQKHCRVDFR